VSFDSVTLRTTLTDATASWVPGELAGALLKPDDANNTLWAYVVDNTEVTVTTWGELPAVLAGDEYRILDLRIAADSPCLDAGDGDHAPALDFFGNARHNVLRVTNSGVGTSAFTDIGVHEYQGD